jgi:hypothetical protein
MFGIPGLLVKLHPALSLICHSARPDLGCRKGGAPKSFAYQARLASISEQLTWAKIVLIDMELLQVSASVLLSSPGLRIFEDLALRRKGPLKGRARFAPGDVGRQVGEFFDNA